MLDRQWLRMLKDKGGPRYTVEPLTDENEALALCIDVGGIDKVMYGSDYPHDIGDMKGCRARVEALPEAKRAMVAYRNAERIFAL